MKNTILAALVAAAVTAGCASAPAGKAQARKECTPPPSELVAKDLVEGKGRPLKFRTAANVWYTGWLYDGCAPEFKGKQFDSNRGKTPFPFMVGAGRVIRGWDEGLVGMREDGRRLLVIPPHKAYGQREFPDGRIPPNSTLVFEVEVHNIVHQPE